MKLRQVRKGVFETNSSSTHSICISKAPVVRLPEKVVFTTGEYRWENECVDDTASYLFTGILDGPEHLRDSRIERLKKLLDELGIEYEFRYPAFNNEYSYYPDCYVDHSYELADFIEAVLTDKDLLIRYLFGDSFIMTGNDNQDPEPSGCNICDKYIYDWDTDKKSVNPYHDEEHYQYFEKGN